MSSSEGGSSSEDEAEASCSRKFEISKIIEAYLDPTAGSLSHPWTFVFDDGMFERQANFDTQLDLWRHLDRIDSGMTKLRLKGKKGITRLYYAESAEAWAQQESVADKWVIRFSRKFPADLADFWLKLVLSILSGKIPSAELVLGCSFKTKKGKSEMITYLKESGIEFENDHLMRQCLGVDKREKTIQFSFKSYRAQLQHEADVARVNQVKQKKAHTWPLVNVEPEEDYSRQMFDPPEVFEQPTQPFRYVFETPSASLLMPLDSSGATLSLEELQELQLQHLRLCSDSEEKPSKEESEEDTMPEIASKAPSPEKPVLQYTPVPIVSRSFPFTKEDCDAEYERRMLYDSPEDELESPHKINPKNCSPPEFVLGTNPPDFSSPLMRAARRFHRRLSL